MRCFNMLGGIVLILLISACWGLISIAALAHSLVMRLVILVASTSWSKERTLNLRVLLLHEQLLLLGARDHKSYLILLGSFELLIVKLSWSLFSRYSFVFFTGLFFSLEIFEEVVEFFLRRDLLFLLLFVFFYKNSI